MKYLVVLVVVLGFACGSEEETLGFQNLEEEGFADSSLMEDGRQATLDPALIIGNIVSALGNLNASDPNAIVNQVLNLLGLGAGGAAAATGILAPLTGLAGVKSIFDAIVLGIVGLVSLPVGIANSILALVGLVVLIIFLIDGGDFGSLVGVRRRSLGSDSWFGDWFDFSNYDLVNSPMVETISQGVFKAIEEMENRFN